MVKDKSSIGLSYTAGIPHSYYDDYKKNIEYCALAVIGQ
jgi:hypothetical protein